MAVSHPLTGGFSNAALDAQKAFRTLLEAWARPGTRAVLSGLGETPSSLDEASAIIALTLIDQDTPVWLSPHCLGSADWLRFHCGCPIRDERGAAAFAFLHADELDDIQDFNPGTAIAPDEGATLVLHTAGLDWGLPVTLTGPGIKDARTARPLGLPRAFWGQRAGLARLYPAGLDVIMTSGSEAMCLPRTTKVHWE